MIILYLFQYRNSEPKCTSNFIDLFFKIDNFNLYYKMTLYHGSQHDFEIAEPRPSTRWRGGVQIYKQTGVHATNILRIALSYCFRAPSEYIKGISLYNDTGRMLLVGQTLDDAITRCTRFPCWIYEFEPDQFKKYDGLGTLEIVSVTSVRPVTRRQFNTWQELSETMRAAELQIEFVTTEDWQKKKK